MNKKLLIALSVVIVLALAGIAGYAFITSPTKAPSNPVPSQTQPTSDRPSPAAPKTASEPTAEAPSGTFRIIPESSKATFSIFEMLRGAPKTVIGATNNISGFFQADPTNLASTTLSAIKINARAFQTDDEKRDNTTRRAILKTENDANEFIIFTPKAMSGVPGAISPGEAFNFQVAGDLFISGVTRETTFTGRGAFTTENEFSGTASTTIKRGDFSLIVPSLPFLADVADEVPLTIEFVAKK
jgi:polyisoprenoid-binding protein YceI